MSRLQLERLAKVEARLGGGRERQRLDRIVADILDPCHVGPAAMALLVALDRRVTPRFTGGDDPAFAWYRQPPPELIRRWRAACDPLEAEQLERALAGVPVEDLGVLVQAVTDAQL
jgi:hypothetical protein